jgi:hypothetical protein
MNVDEQEHQVGGNLKKGNDQYQNSTRVDGCPHIMWGQSIIK